MKYLKCAHDFLKYMLRLASPTNIMDSAELINSELKCLDRWLKANKISINADKTK